MDNLWFDQQAFINASLEQNDIIEVCQLKRTQPANPAYGIPEEKEWVCQRVNGYTIVEEMSTIATNEGASLIKDSKEMVYIFPGDFDPSKVNENTYFKIKGRLSQVSLIKTFLHRGETILYKYQVEETSLSVDL
jgi:hypothetical protein